MTGLCEQIKTAPSREVIESLIAEGSGFKYASNVTKRRWGRLAVKRVMELTAPPKKVGKK